MAEIYQRARHVFAWLGPADKNSDLAICCINTIRKKAEACSMEDAFEVCRKIWHDIVFVPEGLQQLVSVDPIIQNVDESLFTVPRKAMRDLFDVVSG